MVKTFRQFLAEKTRIAELAQIDPMTLRSVIGQMVGASPASNVNMIAPGLAKKDAGLAVAIASDPATEKAKAALDAAKKKTNPTQTQQNPNIGPNIIGAMPGAQI